MPAGITPALATGKGRNMAVGAGRCGTSLSGSKGYLPRRRSRFNFTQYSAFISGQNSARSSRMRFTFG